MRVLRPLAALATAALLGSLALAGPAAAAPALDVSGGGVAGADSVTFTYTLGVPTGSTVAGAVFTTTQDTRLPADQDTVSTVRVDQKPVEPPVTATVANGELTLTLPTLDAGNHTVSFTVGIVGAQPGTTTSYATVTAGGTAYRSPDVSVQVHSPNLVLGYSADFGEAPAVDYAGLGVEDEKDYVVSNIGTQAASAELVLSLPAGLSLEGPDAVEIGEDQTTVRCTSSGTAPHVVVCPIGTVTPGAAPVELTVYLVATSAAPVGERGTYSATVRTADGSTDIDPDNNTLSTPVQFTGQAALRTTVTGGTRTLTVGEKTTFTVTVHNDGPQPALYSIGFADVLGSFNDLKSPVLTISGTDARSTPGPDYPQDIFGDFGGDARFRPHRVGTLDRHAPNFDDLFRFWFPGTIPAGGTSTAHFTVTALRVGTSHFELDALSAAGDPACHYDDVDEADSPHPCEGVVPLTVVAARPTVSPTPTTPGVNGGGVSLANTGSPSTPLLVTGVLLLLAGTVLMRAGRRRAEPAGRHL